MRLVYRDKGCAICLAAGTQAIYKSLEDSNYYEGLHIIGLTFHKLVTHSHCNSFFFTYLIVIKWNTREYSTLVSNPFTNPANASNSLASSSTQAKKDLRRMNSLENGILLCAHHHSDFINFHLAIHPIVRTLSTLPYMTANSLLNRPTKYSLFIVPLSYFMTLK